MKKIFTILTALVVCSAMSFAEVEISLSQSTVDFGSVNLDASDVAGSTVITLNHTGLFDYSGVYFENVEMPEEGALFEVSSEYQSGAGYIYPWNQSVYPEALYSSSKLTVSYLADAVGTYTGTVQFYGVGDEYWETFTDPVILTIKLTVMAAGTAVEQTNASAKVVKRIENGQVIIEKNGVKYNILGSEVK